MSYPRDLEDYTDREIAVELAHRCAERSLGRCAYCRRSSKETPKCGHGEHSKTAEDLRKQLKQLGVIE